MTTNQLVLFYDGYLATTPLTAIALTNRQAWDLDATIHVVTNGSGVYYAWNEDAVSDSWLSEDDGVTWEQVDSLNDPYQAVFWTGSRWLNGMGHTSIDLRSWVTTPQAIGAAPPATPPESPYNTSIFKLDGYIVAYTLSGGGDSKYCYLTDENTWETSNDNVSYAGSLIVVNDDETMAVRICSYGTGNAVEILTDPTVDAVSASQNPVDSPSFTGADGDNIVWTGGGYDTTDNTWYLFGYIDSLGDHDYQLVWTSSTDGDIWDVITLESFEARVQSALFDGTYWWLNCIVNSATAKVIRFDGTTFVTTTLTAVGDGVMGALMAGSPSPHLPLTGVNGTLLEVDSGEPVSLDDVEVTLERDVDLNGSYETVVATSTVLSNGQFYFDYVEPGDYRITIGSLPPGYTGPAAQTFTLSAGETETRTFTFNAAKISGHVFYDPDVDEVYAGTEDGVPGYKVDISKDSVYLGTATTDANGYFEFTLLESATYELELFRGDGSSVHNDGYDYTTSNTLEFIVSSSADETANFGIATSTITGVVFRDGDGDGLNNQALAYPAYYPQVVYYKDVFGVSVTIDGSQNFEFTNFIAGDYFLYVPGTGTNQQYMLTSGNSYRQISTPTYNVIEFTIGIGETLNFELGIAEPAIPVYVDFVDVDNDGLYVDPPDYLGFVDVDMTIERSDLGADSYSAFEFDDIGYGSTRAVYRPGDYRISYVSNLLPFGSLGYVATCSPIEITLNEGDTPDIYFGATELLPTSGRVFLDEDYDGLDESHPGVEGIVVNLMDGVTVVDTDTTDSNGDFSMMAVFGTYTIVVEPGSYVLTTPNEIETTLEDDTPFGLIQPGTVTVHAWEDLDGDAILDGGETTFTVGGVEVGVYQGVTLIDSGIIDISGEITFVDLLPGSYTVRIISVPLGYQATTSDRSLSLIPEENDSINIGVRLDLGQPIRPPSSGWGYISIT